MRKTCLILICLTLSHSTMAAVPRQITCDGQMSVLQVDHKQIDRGAARVRFDLVDENTIRNVRVVSKFLKTKPQAIETFEARAIQRGVASGRFRGDLFPLGENGACQIALGYQGQMIKAPLSQMTSGLLGMNCGTYAVSGQLRCQAK